MSEAPLEKLRKLTTPAPSRVQWYKRMPYTTIQIGPLLKPTMFHHTPLGTPPPSREIHENFMHVM